MKRAVFYILFVMVVGFGFVSCFASKFIEEKIIESVDIESVLFSNYEKSMEAREKMMDELLAYFESSGVISQNIKREVRNEEMSLNEKEESVNIYFDALDNMETTSAAIIEVENKVVEIGEKYEAAFSQESRALFEDGKIPEGMAEDDKNLIIGGDIYFDKSIPENTGVLVNMIRVATGKPKLSEKEIAKRGFYCSQSAFMWSNTLWKDGKVKYRIAGGVSAKEESIILGCMKKWEDASEGKIKFSRYRNSFWNRFRWKYFLSRHVQISVDANIGNSWATLGEQVRAQLHIDNEYFVKKDDGSLAFDKEVIESEILHEMGHILTLFHEHQRNDRDEYIKVNYDRAAVVNNWSKEKATAQYGKINLYEHKITNEYDYKSIMHYWSSQSNEAGERDIETLTGEAIPRAMDLSEVDKAFIKELYSENGDR